MMLAIDRNISVDIASVWERNTIYIFRERKIDFIFSNNRIFHFFRENLLIYFIDEIMKNVMYETIVTRKRIESLTCCVCVFSGR